MRFTVWIGILFCLALYKVQGQVTCVSEGEPAVLSCGVALSGGLTLRLATWRKVGTPDVVVAQYVIGTSDPGPDYTGRASINDTGFLLLEQVTQDDGGTYRCQATLSDLSSLPVVDERVELRPSDPPVMTGVTVNATLKTDTSAEVEWNQVQSSSPCEDVLIYHVDYKLETTSSWNIWVETVSGSANGNNVLRLTVTGLNIAGDYIFGVRANNSVGSSSRAESSPVYIPGDGSNSGNGDIWPWLGLGIGVVGVVFLLAVCGGTFTWWRMYKGLMKLDLRPLRDRRMAVEWTAPRDYERASYQVAFRPKGSKVWTRGPDVSTNHPPHFKHTVDFPDFGKYQLCVFVKIDGEDEKKSDIEGVIIKRSASGSLDEPNTQVSSLHGNDTSRTESHIVFMNTDGRSPPPRLDPLVNKKNPAAKKGKKEKGKKKSCTDATLTT